MPLGSARGAGGVEDVQRIGGGDGHAVDRLAVGDQLGPVVVPSFDELRLRLRPRQDDARARLVRRQLDGLVEQRLVGQHPAGLDPGRGRQHDDGLGVLEALGELFGGEAAEHDGVDGAESSAGQHAHHGLGHHRHADDDAVSLGDAQPGQRTRQPGDLVAQLGVGVRAHGAGDGAVVDQRCAVACPPPRRAGRARCGRCSALRRRTSGRRAAGRRPARGRPARYQSSAAAASPQKLSGVLDAAPVSLFVRAHLVVPLQHFVGSSR